MSFSTGTPQRRGSQSTGVSKRHVAQTPYPAADILRQPAGIYRSTVKRRRTASVGDDGATGLVIRGSHDYDPMEGTDPDGTTPPISGATLSNPDFPISYTGRGTLKFVSPVRIAAIDGPLNVNGDIYSNAGLLTSTDTMTSVSLQVGGTGAGVNFTENASSTYAAYQAHTDRVHLICNFVWSSKGSVTDGTNIFIKGLPFLSQTSIQKVTVHTTNITPVEMGSYFVVESPVDSTELQLYAAASSTGVEVPITGLQCASTGSIHFSLSYPIVI